MGSSCLHVYLHVVWHTKHRKPILRRDLEQFVHRRIPEITDEQRLGLIAINSAWNHVHVLVRWNASCSIGTAVGRWKGATSSEWEPPIHGGEALAWQRGYGALSVRKNEIDKLKYYIARQKHHHRYDTTIDSYER